MPERGGLDSPQAVQEQEGGCKPELLSLRNTDQWVTDECDTLVNEFLPLPAITVSAEVNGELLRPFTSAPAAGELF